MKKKNSDEKKSDEEKGDRYDLNDEGYEKNFSYIDIFKRNSQDNGFIYNIYVKEKEGLDLFENSLELWEVNFESIFGFFLFSTFLYFN